MICHYCHQPLAKHDAHDLRVMRPVHKACHVARLADPAHAAAAVCCKNHFTMEWIAMSEFVEFPKMARFSRECVVTEKIDGTNACIYIGENGEFMTGSRTRWITPEDDNFGFAAWAHKNRDELMQLGTGRHFGEWWGAGIQRNYGLSERRFSLFNALRWVPHGTEPAQIPTGDPRVVKMQQVAPKCCHVVPILARGVFDSALVEMSLDKLREEGSAAAPGFKKPEGVVVFHVAGGLGFKKTLDRDGMPKGMAP